MLRRRASASQRACLLVAALRAHRRLGGRDRTRAPHAHRPELRRDHGNDDGAVVARPVHAVGQSRSHRPPCRRRSRHSRLQDRRAAADGRGQIRLCAAARARSRDCRFRWFPRHPAGSGGGVDPLAAHRARSARRGTQRRRRRRRGRRVGRSSAARSRTTDRRLRRSSDALSRLATAGQRAALFGLHPPGARRGVAAGRRWRMSAPVKLDPGARQRLAADPKASAWVAASAGTGKTKVLTDRVLALLLAGSAPARILCLTFTKAAAAEMAIRVGTRLSDWATKSDAKLREDLASLTDADADPDLRDRARQLFARVLDAPGGMRIETIHAFCQSLLRRFPLEAGIPPHFQVMEERSTAEAMGHAVAQVLDRARDGKPKALKSALDAVTQIVGEDGFIELVAKLAVERGRLDGLRRGGDAKFEGRLRERFGLQPGETPDSIVRQACKEGAFDGAALKRAARVLGQSDSSFDQKAGQALGQWLGRVRSRVHGFDEYCAAYFTKEGARRVRLVTKAALALDPALGEVLAREAERLEAVRARRDAARLVEATAALIRLAGAVLDAYGAHKTARALLDFDDLVLKAKDLLRRPGVAPWVLFKLDGGIDHILIDEAQDTNPDQWEVIAALAEEFFVGEGARHVERTVFAVGDPKQSIFSFQRADPRAFVAMREHFRVRVEAAGRTWQPLALELSFRSVAAVLQTVDAVFADQRVSAGVALEDEIIRHEPHRLGAAGLVELWPPVSPETDEPPTPWDAPLSQARLKLPRARLADAIAATVKSWLDTGETLEASGRPMHAGDILVLVRRRNPFVGARVRALKERDVPVAGVDRMVLADQLAVQDLVALAQFLLLPADDLTLATVLKSPLYGFDEQQLFDLAWPRSDSLWDELRQRAGENPTFRFAADELAALLARADFIPPFELFAEVLGVRDGRRKILARLGAEANDPL